MNPRRLLPFTAAITCVLTASAPAGDVIKANNTTNLNLAGSWLSGTPIPPDSTAVAVWNNTVTGYNVSALGGDLSWQGIRIANVGGVANPSSTTGGVQITNALSANTLTLGTAGIDMSAATQALLIQSKIALSGNQTWNIANANTNGAPFAGNGINAGMSEDLMFAAQANATMNLGGFTLGTSGLGSIGISSGYTLSNGTLNLANANTWIQSGGSRTTALASDLSVTIAANSNLRLRANSGAGGIGINSAAPISVSGTGSRLQLEVNNSGNSLIQSGNLTFGNGSTLEAIVNNAGAFTISAPTISTSLTAASMTWLVNGGSAGHANGVAVSGNITGNGVIAYQNTASGTNGQIRLSGDNSGFTGTMNLNGGSGNRSLRLSNATAGSSAAIWTVGTANTLQVDGVAVNLGTLNGAGTVTNSHASNVAGITVGSGSFSGAITNGTPLLGMSLTKNTPGILTLSGANTYTGLTDIQGGTLSTTTLQTGGGAVTVGDAGTFALTQSANGSTFNISNLTLGSTSGSKLTLTGAAAPSVPLITAPNFTVNGSSTITLKGTPVNNMTLIDYTGSIGGGGFGGLTLVTPFRTSGTLFHDTTNTLVQLTSYAADTLKWQGNVTSEWDIDTTNGGVLGTANFKTTATPSGARYVEAGVGLVDFPVFDDTATGSTEVTLGTTVTPVGITFNNSTLAYSISGAGSIAGAGSVVKNGTAATTLATNNTYTGGTSLNAGTLNVNHANALGTGALTIAGGTLDNTSGSAKVATNAQNWNGDFTFTGSNDLTLGTAAMNANRQVTVSAGTLSVGAVTGGFGLTKAGAGTLAVGAGSSYSGATVVNNGVLKATAASAFSASSSSVTLADNAGVALDLNGFNQTVNNLSGGGVTGGNVNLNGGVLTANNSVDSTFAGALIGTTGGLTKTGNGRLILSGVKSGYTGTTNVTGGTLDLGAINGNFGAAVTVTGGAANNSIIVGSGLFVQGNGTLNTGISGGSAGFGARGGNLTVNVGGAGAPISFNSGGTGGLGGFIFGSATSDSKVIVQNNLDINNFNGSRDITVNTGTGTASAEISGVIYQSTIANINKKGAGDLILSGANTYSGETQITLGRIVLGNNLALQNSPINTDNVGKIDATGFTTPTFGGLKGSANLSALITSGYSDITTLTLNTVNTNAALTTAGKTLTTFAGAITDGAAGMNLVKSGAGTQTLNGANTYSGATTINGGTLALGASGSIDNTSGVSLGTNGTFDVSLKSGGYTVSNLSGSGAVKGALTVSTQLAIGNSPGTATFDSGLTLDSATYVYEMTGGASPALGSADLANITGTLTISAGSILDLVELGTYTVGNKFTLFGYTTGITGTFDGLADGAEFNDDLANKWQIDYNDTTAGLNGGIGTSFVTITAVPEPDAALLGGLGLLALLRRRRHS